MDQAAYEKYLLRLIRTEVQRAIVPLDLDTEAKRYEYGETLISALPRDLTRYAVSGGNTESVVGRVAHRQLQRGLRRRWSRECGRPGPRANRSRGR